MTDVFEKLYEALKWMGEEQGPIGWFGIVAGGIFGFTVLASWMGVPTTPGPLAEDQLLWALGYAISIFSGAFLGVIAAMVIVKTLFPGGEE